MRNHIRKLSLFGSILTSRFRPESDIDVLVEFEPGSKVTLFDVAGMELELTGKLNRKVDLRRSASLNSPITSVVLDGLMFLRVLTELTRSPAIKW